MRRKGAIMDKTDLASVELLLASRVLVVEHLFDLDEDTLKALHNIGPGELWAAVCGVLQERKL